MTFTPTPIDYTAPADTLATGALAINTNFQTLAAASFDYMATALTGGTTGTLDDIDGDLLAGGERALVTIGNNPAQVYIYVCDVDNAGSESSPYIIAPDDHPGDKRWVLAARIPRTWIGGAAPTANEDSGDGVSNGDLWLYGGNAWICSDNTLTASVWVLLLKIGSGATEAVAGNDSRLTNNRTPNAHTLIDGTGHTATGLTAGHVVTATGAAAYAFQDLGLAVAGYTAKTAPVDADYLPLMDSETTPTANLIKKLSWSHIKSVLKTYFDGLYTLSNLGGIAASTKGAASGVASLNASTKVVEDPANATTTPTASKIPVADGSGKLAAGWGGSASTLATLNSSSKVVEDPANATSTKTASKIPIADGSGYINTWIQTGTATGTMCAGDDSRLSNARTPAAHNLIDTTGHPVSGLTTNHVLRATGATTYGFGTIPAGSISDATATPTASKIPIANGSAKLDGWITATPDAAAAVKGITQLSGDFGGSATAPTVVGIHSGGTALAISTITDGQYLKRDGTNIVSASVTSGISTGKAIAMSIVFS